MININVREYRTANLKKDNPEKLATQDEEKQNKTKTQQYVLDNIIHKQAQTTQTRHAPSYKEDMLPSTNHWQEIWTEHRVYSAITRDITTRNLERKDTYVFYKAIYRKL